MRVIYDPAADALYIRMAAAKVNHSDQALDDAGVIFDFNAVAGLHWIDKASLILGPSL
jgi:uncharacterized protein YuzE